MHSGKPWERSSAVLCRTAKICTRLAHCTGAQSSARVDTSLSGLKLIELDAASRPTRHKEYQGCSAFGPIDGQRLATSPQRPRPINRMALERGWPYARIAFVTVFVGWP